ncbi:MAG: hypothetical protein ABFD46_12890 [Armatimonadota bacterium]
MRSSCSIARMKSLVNEFQGTETLRHRKIFGDRLPDKDAVEHVRINLEDRACVREDFWTYQLSML